MRRFLLLLSLALIGSSALTACPVRGGRGSSGDDDDDAAGATCADADSAAEQCYEDALLGSEFVARYCDGEDLDPGDEGYFGPGTDWECIVAAWSYDCSTTGPVDGEIDSLDCFIDDGLGDDDDASDDDDATGDDDDDDSTPPGDDDDSTPPGDDDDSTSPGDDDDSTPPGDDDDATGGTGAGAIPCNASAYADIYEIWGVSGSAQLTAIVDTVSSATTFDPVVVIYDGPDPTSAGVLASGDDEFTCTFPPPTYSCPEATAATSPTGSYYVLVSLADPTECASSIGEYELIIEENGSFTNDWSLFADDLLPPP